MSDARSEQQHRELIETIEDCCTIGPNLQAWFRWTWLAAIVIGVASTVTALTTCSMNARLERIEQRQAQP